MTPQDLDVLVRRLRERAVAGKHRDCFYEFHEPFCRMCRDVELWNEAADALTLLSQERTAVQGLIETWRKNADNGYKFDRYERKGYKACADQLEATLSGLIGSSHEDQA